VGLTREEKLQSTVKRVFHSEGVPLFEHHAREVYTRALDPEGGAADLTRIILKDLGLTSQILRVANSSLYNRSGRTILSVAHGITLLGWDTVCDLVSAMKYVEHFAARSPGVRELMLLSLLSASHARGVALQLSYPHPEDAYIAGLFRNMGEILVACYYPREYCDIVLAVREHHVSHKSACVRVMDFSWDDLAARVAKSWDLPQEVRICLDGTGGVAKAPLHRSLTSIVDYGQELTRALYRNGARPDSIHLRTVLDATGRTKLITVRDIRAIVDNAMDGATQTMTTLRIPMDALKVEQQAEMARTILDSLDRDPSEHSSIEYTETEGPSPREQESGEFGAMGLISAVLKSVCEAGFDRALFALVSENGDTICGHICEGIGADLALPVFQFSMAQPDGPLRAAISRQRILLVDCQRDTRYGDSVLVETLRPRCFALYPVVVEGATVGCIYADAAGASVQLERARAAMDRAADVAAAVITRAKAAGACPAS
jgi:hypothetical protein